MIRFLFEIIVMVYIWILYFFLLVKKEEQLNYYSPVSVIIPCYNEDKKYLIKCITSVMEAEGEKQVILINNNSKKQETFEAFEYLKTKYPNLYFLNEFKQGKRFAHKKGLEYAKHKIIVFIDSDTIIDKKAIIEIVKPYQNKNVGGVAGKVVLLNKDSNLITKSINSMFWSSSSLFRKSTSNIGFMQVSAGALSSYRKESLLKIENKYINQKFMRRPCGISDDRFLTMRVQTLLGQDIKYTDKAISYTMMPETFIGFWKVLERWKRGVIREVLLFWKEPKSKAKKLFFDTQFNFLIMNVMFVFKIILLYQLIFNFSFVTLLMMGLWLLLMSLLYGSYMIVKNPKEFGYKILYTIFYEVFWSWSYFNALWNIRNQGAWKTR